LKGGVKNGGDSDKQKAHKERAADLARQRAEDDERHRRGLLEGKVRLPLYIGEEEENRGSFASSGIPSPPLHKYEESDEEMMPAPPPLPKGWLKIGEGRDVYFWHKASNKTQWERP
jgi:hypothetical protein